MLTAHDIETIIHQGLPAAKEQGLHIDATGADWAEARLDYSPMMLRPGGSISGPTIMGLADAAMYAAIMARLGRLEMAVTQDLNIHFLRKPREADLVARAHILRLGRRSVVLDVQVFSADDRDRPVAFVTGTYALPASGG
jgi:uncharacterized protein (TIGR00369 family)